MISVVFFANEGWVAIDQESGQILGTGSDHASYGGWFMNGEFENSEIQKFMAIDFAQMESFEKFLRSEA